MLQNFKGTLYIQRKAVIVLLEKWDTIGILAIKSEYGFIHFISIQLVQSDSVFEIYGIFKSSLLF